MSTGGTVNGMSLPEFVDWFRDDLTYRAPEGWPGAVSWFLEDLVQRYGNAPDLRPGLFDKPLPGQLGAKGYERAVELCRLTHEAATDRDGGPTVAGGLLGQLAVLLSESAQKAGAKR